MPEEMTVKTERGRTWLLLWAVLFAAGCLCFIPMLATGLTTHFDGLWNVESSFVSDEWELSLGRFVIWLMDRLRFGYAGDPFQSYLTLALLAFGNVLLMDLFGFAARKTAYLCGIMLQTSTSVCAWLSYRYTAPSFGMAYLLGVLSAWILTRKARDIRRELLLAACACGVTVLTLGTYQANLGCTCAIVLLFAFRMCLQGEASLREVWRFLLKSGAVIACGCVLYRIVWRITMAAANITPADYRGASALSVPYLLRSFPGSVKTTYLMFYAYFTQGGDTKCSIFQGMWIHAALIALVLILLLLCAAWLLRSDVKKGLTALLMLCAMPPAVLVWRVLSPDALGISVQMTASLTIVAPLCIMVLWSAPFARMTLYGKRVFPVLLTMTAFFLAYGRIYQTAVDLSVMQEGRSATQTLISHAVSYARSAGFYDPDKRVMFVGVPADSPCFEKPVLWDKANAYARYGNFWRGGVSYRNTYHGSLYTLGIHWDLVTLEEYLTYFESPEIDPMPFYPEEGCVKEIDDIVVIRLADR